MNNFCNKLLRVIVGLMSIMITTTALQAQYKEVYGFLGKGGYDKPSYYYNYVAQPNGGYTVEQCVSGYLTFYEYYIYGINEFIVTKDDLIRAGVCPGPIDALSLRMLKTSRVFQGNWRVFIKHIPANQYILTYPNNNNPNYGTPYEPYNLYFYTISGWSNNTGPQKLRAAPGAVEVYSNANWTMPLINDSTWVDWEFNQSFVWDGTSNIVVGLFRCWPNDGNFETNYSTSNMYLQTRTFTGAPYDPYGYNANVPPYSLGTFPNYPPFTDKIMYYSYAGNSCDYSTTTYLGLTYGYNIYQVYNPNPYEYYYNYYWMRPVIRLRNLAGLTGSFPDDVDPKRILRATEVYGGQDANHPKPSITYYGQVGKTYTFKYWITGPNPGTNTVYQARQNGNTTITINSTANGFQTFVMPDAIGSFAGTAGALDLTNASGGSYRLNVEFTGDCGVQNWVKQFIVAFPWDVAMAQIRSPQPSPKKNPLNVTLPLGCQLQNVGLNNVTNVDVRAIVKTYPAGTVVYDHESNWTGNMATGDRASVDITGKSFIPSAAGRYTVEFCASLNDNFGVDQQTSNDCLPNNSEPYIFEVNYNEEAGAGQINIPSNTGTYYANRPLQPAGTIFNNGILDLSDVPVKMEIFKLPGNQKVYSEQVVVQSVDASTPNNYAAVQFPLFTPDAAGQYQVCMTTLYPGDPDASNDQVCQLFNVGENLNGTYTIGLLNAGKARNYPTFEIAANDLYMRGVSGPVTFELTDATYTLNATPATNNVALDLSGYVPGMSSTNTVTFKPSLERSLSKGSIAITMNSLNGIGVLFGQQLEPSNVRSLAREFPTVRAYSNSAGYYTFDGGLQKSIKVLLGASTAFRAPFYLGDGSTNITVKNVIIGNAPNATPSYAWSLPRIFYTNGQFTYESDVRTINAVTFTYSGGIVSRGKLPIGTSGNNAERLDTIKNDNNKFIGNEISGFGYGVVSLGIGTLLKGGVNTFQSYYSTGTEISNNLITSVSRAGVYAGYEDGPKITGNRIHTVGLAPYVKDAAGIYLGGNNQYNVMDAKITGNEISGVKADSASRGIHVEQVRNAYQSVTSSGGIYYAPSRAENTQVSSNAVWGLVRTTTGGSTAGIHLQTGRLNNQTLVPVANDYFTRGDLIANNTVFMTNDNVVGTSASNVLGIGVAHGNGTMVKNNAIAMLGASNASSTLHAALFNEGTLFRDTKANDWYLPNNAPAALVSDKNAFWTPNSGLGYFVEISDQSQIVSTGSPSEYQTLSQWRTGTKQDISSVTGDFTQEHEYKGVAPNQTLRVKTNPQPIGSIINQRGDRIASITTDIDGQTRGAAGLGYDIGADEFDGRLYVSDLEVIEILKPSAYKSSTGTTSDAEYIMTTAPVDAIARIRNNGALPRTNADVRVRIYLETPASNNADLTTPAFNAVPVVDRVVKIDLVSGESKDQVFGIPGFIPQTFQQLSGYTAPTRFSVMSMNATPRYRVDVSTSPDENNTNNLKSKVVRFYIKRSTNGIVLSARNASGSISASSTTNQIAGRLNSDSLQKSMRDLGFVNNPGTNTFSFDVFDRGAWEGRAVDYTMYSTLFWAHDQTALLRTERDDLRNYIDAGTPGAKKNLAMGSQEPVRRHQGTTIAADADFVNRVLRAQYVAPGTPATPDYTNKRIVGRAIARNTEETVRTTGFPNDASSQPALMRVFSSPTTPGIAQAAYIFKAGDRTTVDSVAGTATASLTANVVYVGVDWRHFSRPSAFTGGERVLRGIIDFFESNGGSVVGAEVVSFDAKARNRDADVFWTTASERNADHFDVQRMQAEMTAEPVTGAATNGSAEWQTVATLPASGTTTDSRDYSITDKGLADGTWLYRLVTVDRDGSTNRTPAVEVVIGSTSELTVVSLAPQPAPTSAILQLFMPSTADVRVEIVNNSGELVGTAFTGTLAQGTQPVTISTSQLASGVYTLLIKSDIGTTTVSLNVVR